jgi:ComF family protein
MDLTAACALLVTVSATKHVESGYRLTSCSCALRPPRKAPQFAQAAGSSLIHCRRSSMRLATSSCSHGAASGAVCSHRATATGSRVGGRCVLVMRLNKRVTEYIEVVLNPRLSELFGRSPSRGLRRWSLLSQCAVCRSWPATQVCDPCASRFSSGMPRCPLCASHVPIGLFPLAASSGATRCASCIRQPPPVDLALACFDYVYPWSRLITRFKFGDQPGWASFFAARMLACAGMQQAFDALGPDDLVVPIPLSAERLQMRGFNQSWELARALARQSGTRASADARLLLRIRHTRAQTELQRHERIENLKGAFQVEPLRASALDGRRLVLVDDVMTSGASIYTAAQALRSAGVAHITAVVLARTPLP